MDFSPRSKYGRPVRALITIAIATFIISWLAIGHLFASFTAILPLWWDTATLTVLAMGWVALGIYHQYKKLPAGLNIASPVYHITADDVSFYHDTAYSDTHNQRHHDQEIVTVILRTIRGAKRYILCDMFLWNSFPGRNQATTRPIAKQATECLALQKQHYPDLTATVIVDPINTVYGGYISPELSHLTHVGVKIIITNLLPLRDSNPFYSGLWRLALRWLVAIKYLPSLPHPFNTALGAVPMSSYITAFNAKGNHRKLLVADDDAKQLVTIITSANLHDGSGAHSNVAVSIKGALAVDVIKSEQVVAAFSGVEISGYTTNPAASGAGSAKVQILTEAAILHRILTILSSAQAGDTIDLIMFALADRRVVAALLAASRQGVIIRIILDPNQEAFGYSKAGLPNQPVAWELQRRSNTKITIRWYATAGEQCHSKMLLHRHNQTTTLLLGSANFTRRNLRNYNLEMDAWVQGGADVPALARAADYFETLWHNRAGNIYTTEYTSQARTTIFKYVRYWLQEVTGISAN